MKKSIIKRRKRVVPATQEQSPKISNQTAFPSATSPDSNYQENVSHALPDMQVQRNNSSSETFQSEPVDLNLRFRNQKYEHHHHFEPPPIGVDFTGYQLEQTRRASQPQRSPLPSIQDPPPTSAPETPYHTPLGSLPPAHARKRSFSKTDSDNMPSPSTPDPANRSNRLSSISSILNPQQQSGDDMAIDPTLSGLNQQHRHSIATPHHQMHHPQLPLPHPEMRSRSVGNGDPGGWGERMERKARLRREADEMKEMLRAKEREIEALDGEG